jgi:hypothetical protein
MLKVRTQAMNNNEYPILFEDCVVKGDFIYFFSESYNALFSYNYILDKLTYISGIPDECFLQERLIGNILSYESYLILVPMRTVANNVWFFDLMKGSWSNISIELDGVHPPYEKIAYATIYGNNLILVGCYYGGIININLVNKEIIYYKDLFENELKIHSLFGCETIGDKIYIPSPECNKVFEYNINSNDGTWTTVGAQGCSYSGMIWTGKSFWLAPFKGTDLVEWDGKKIYKQVKIPESFYKQSGYLFRGIGKIGEEIYVVGLKGKQSISFKEIDCNDQKIINNSYFIYKKLPDDGYIIQDYMGNVQMLLNSKVYNFSLLIKSDDIVANATANNIDELRETDNSDLRLFLKII